MKKAIMTFLVFVIGAFIFVGCGGSTPNTSPVRITTDPTVPPTTTAKPTTATPTTKAPTTVAPTTEAPKPTDLRISEQQIIFGVGDSFSLNGAVIEKLVSSNWTTAEDSEYTIDSSNYNGEIEGAYSITVSLKNTTVTETYHVLVLENDTFNATYGNTLANVTLPSKLAWKTSTTSVGNAGTNAFDAVFTVDEHTKYDIKVDVVVAKANYTCTAPTGLTGSYGAALSTVSLANVAASCSSVAGTWTWKNGTSIIDATGEHAFTAVFTPTNTNYLTKEIQITLTIAKGTLQVNVNNDVIEYDGNDHGANVTCEGATITYGLTEGTYDLTTSPVYKEMGKYTVYYKAVKANYNDATGVAYIEIKKMPKAKITAFVLQEKYPVYMELTAIEIIHLFDVPGNISWVKSNATIE